MAENYFDGIDLDSLDADVGASDDADRRRVGSANKDDWFKGEKGKNYRVAFVYYHPLQLALAMAVRKKTPTISKEQLEAEVKTLMGKRAEKLGKPLSEFSIVENTFLDSPQFKTVKAYYKEGFGYTCEPKQLSSEDRRILQSSLGDSRQYVTTLLLFYPVDREGEPIKAGLTENWTIRKWRMSTQTYDDVFKTAHSLRQNDLTLAGQDILLTCTNDKFQQFKIVGAGKALYRREPLSTVVTEYNGRKVSFQEAILMAAADLAGPGGKNLVPFKEYSMEQIKEKLGLLPVGGSSSDISDTVDTTALLDSFG